MLLCSGCDSTPTAPAGRRGSQPPTTSVAPLPPTQPVSAPATQPTSAAAEAPEYVTVVDRYKPAARATISVATERGNRLVIATRNVKRLRIDRNRVPLDPDRSIALELDGQGLEWLRWSKVSEFERSPNGDWKPVRP